MDSSSYFPKDIQFQIYLAESIPPFTNTNPAFTNPRELLRDDLISQARVAEEVTAGEGGQGGENNMDGFVVHTKAEEMEENLRILREMDGDSSEDEDDEEGGGSKEKAEAKTTVSFQIKGDSVEVVKRRDVPSTSITLSWRSMTLKMMIRIIMCPWI